MYKTTRFFGGAVFVAVLLGAGVLSPQAAQAASLTSAQISAIIGLLQSFGADQTTINNVQVALGGTTGGGIQAWCHTFNRDLTVGSTGADVSALNRALSSSGIDITGNSSSFTENTAAAVVQFQSKYGIRQTGYVGPITRAKLNKLYGCSVTTDPLPPLPFCGQPPMPTCSADLACIQMMPQPKTYTNYDSFKSDRAQYLYDGYCKVSQSIQTISPNGGEQWQKGTTQNIKWTAPLSVSSVSISLEQWYACLYALPRCAIAVRLYTLTASTPNDGVFEWTVGKDSSGTDIPAGQYIVTVSGGAFSDVSDKPFDIVAASTPVGSLSINPTSAGIKVGGTTTFQAMYQPSYSCEPPRYCAIMAPYPVQVVWTSSNPKVATVAYKEIPCPAGSYCFAQQFDSLTAVVTGVSLGTATITAAYKDSFGVVFTASAPVSTVMQ